MIVTTATNYTRSSYISAEIYFVEVNAHILYNGIKVFESTAVAVDSIDTCKMPPKMF